MPDPKLTERASFSAPEGFFSAFNKDWKAQGFGSASEYLRALYDAAKHYHLRPAIDPQTLDRVLRSPSDIETESGRGRQGGQLGEKPTLGRRKEG